MESVINIIAGVIESGAFTPEIKQMLNKKKTEDAFAEEFDHARMSANMAK